MPTFLLDENIHEPDYIIERCAEFDIEVVRVHQLDLDNTEDEVIFEFAMNAGYIIVTANVRDFRPLQTAWIEAEKVFPGVIYVSRNKYRNPDLIIQRIVEVESDPIEGSEWWVS
jgi:hypothetical protein